MAKWSSPLPSRHCQFVFIYFLNCACSCLLSISSNASTRSTKCETCHVFLPCILAINNLTSYQYHGWLLRRWREYSLKKPLTSTPFHTTFAIFKMIGKWQCHDCLLEEPTGQLSFLIISYLSGKSCDRLYTKKINIPVTHTTIYISRQHLPYHFIRLSLRFFWLILLLHYANLTTEMSSKNIRELALQVTLSSLIHYQSGKWPYPLELSCSFINYKA